MIEVRADKLKVGDVIEDRTLAGIHGDKVNVQWVGHHDRRGRTYLAGVERSSLNPVQLAYDDDKLVTVVGAWANTWEQG